MVLVIHTLFLAISVIRYDTGGTQLREDSIRTPCHECDSNQGTHLCEDCGVVLCAGCLETKTTQYTVCNECHANLGMPSHGEQIEFCSECESTNLGKGRRVEEICPQCHSSRIVSIEEKRRGLAQDLRSAIMSLHYGHTKLREFNSSLISAKRLLVSLRMASFLHYKWLEDNIESLQEETSALKNRIMNQAEIISKRIAAETKGLIDYNRWTTAQFPFIEGITHRVTQIGDQYKGNVDDALKTARIALDDIIKQLEGLDYYRKRFSGFYEVTELSVNELPVCALPEIRITGSDFLRNDKATGTLYITNRRIVFIAETGLVRKKMEIIFDFPLLYLTSIEEDGRFRKRLVLKMKQGEVKIACNEQTQRVLPDYVEIGRKFDRYQQTDLQRVRKIEQTDANISDVRIKIESLVYSLLSPGTQSMDTSSQSRDRLPYRDYRIYEQPRPQRRFSGNDYGVPDYRQDPRIQEDRRRELPVTRPSHYKTDLSALQRDAMDLEDALTATKELFRAGRIVPEDFIRRYKVLMRNSYDTRQAIQRLQSDTRTPKWEY